MEHEMETGGIIGFRELKLSYYSKYFPLFTDYTYYDNSNSVLSQPLSLPVCLSVMADTI